ncbi:MAG: alpha/beta fold hydrolase [Rhodospirillaceae bacterium]|jgi:pimeloyl-ACP methyl ester carboxylesterase|nr:alpha/beta fold hydrolase [Rhodospirillaceae bacterium]MBT5457716.1 alpha/beta fold hydrolase [Rhodospirillaceae bacterium]
MPSIEANGEQIYFVDEGDGPPVLFIHSLGTNNYLYRDQIAELKSRYRCIAPDCRAHGASSYTDPFTVEDMADDHKAVLDHLGIDSCHVVGLSMGGPIALSLNARYPGVVKSLVLADSFARIRPGGEDRIYATQEAVAYLSMLEFGSQYAGDRLMPTTDMDKLDELAAEISKCPPKGYVETVRAVFTHDSTGDLAKVGVPTVILIGDSDDATPMAESEYIRDGIAGSDIKVIPDAGHLSTIDSPAEFTAELGSFLDRQ